MTRREHGRHGASRLSSQLSIETEKVKVQVMGRQESDQLVVLRARERLAHGEAAERLRTF